MILRVKYFFYFFTCPDMRSIILHICRHNRIVKSFILEFKFYLFIYCFFCFVFNLNFYYFFFQNDSF